MKKMKRKITLLLGENNDKKEIDFTKLQVKKNFIFLKEENII